MPNDTIDTLNIEISSSTTKAVRALDNLSKKLSGVNKELQSVNTGGLRNYARDMGRVSASIKALNGIKVNIPNLSGLSKQLENLGKVDFSKLTGSAQPLKDLASGLQSLSGLQNISIPKLDTKNINSVVGAVEKLSGIDTAKIPQISDGLTRITHAMSVLNTVDFSDSKITTAIGSLKRLLSVDMRGFDTTVFSNISSAIGTLANVPDVSSSLNRFISSLAKLAGTGPSISTVSSQLPALGTALRDTVNKMASAGNISDSVNLFTQSIGRLASAGAKTGQTAEGLDNLAEKTLDFFKSMQNAPRISENTIRMTQALAQLASAGGRVGTATNTVTSAFNKLSGIASRSANAIKKASSSIVSAFQKIGNSSAGIKTASLNLGTLLKTAVGFQAIRGLVEFGKNAIDLGSDITEIENVVDVAFGSMASKAYDFSATASKQFGLSELSAKQYSGTMMAMLKSSGVVQSAAADMSITLAGLAGDLASFYNLDTDVAFEKIRSGISGETEPLKQLGINMSVANLEAYALANGITKSYQAMTQAEQATLRYNYLMSVTGDAQGDFARTSGTWANQIRLLTLNFQSLSAVIGQGLIAAILPVIQVLNALLAKLMQVAEAFRNFVYTLVGKKLEGSQKGITDNLSGVSDISNGLEDIGSAGGDAAGGMDTASTAAKKLKKTLSVLPFDELNQLSAAAEDVGDNLSGAGGTGGGGGVPSLASPDFGGLSDALDDLKKQDVETPINKWAKRIRKAFLKEDWEGLGKEIAWGINKGLQFIYDAINWNKVGPKITKFTDAFTRTFNSIVDNINWDLMGRTVGAGINTIVNTLNQLIEGIRWKSLGAKFADGIMGLVREVNWTNLGNLLGNGFMISWNILYGLVTNLNFSEIGTALGEAVNGIFEKVDFVTIGTVFAEGFNGIFETLKNFTLTVKWDDIATNIYTGLNTMIHTIDWVSAGESFNLFVGNLLNTIFTVAENTDWEAFGEGIGEFLSGIDWIGAFGKVFGIIKEVVGGFITGFQETTAGKFILAFGAIKLAIKGVKLASSISGVIKKLDTLKSKLPSIAEIASSTSVNWGVLSKAILTVGSALLGAQIGMKLTETTLNGSEESFNNGTLQIANFSNALVELANQGFVTSEQQASLNETISELAEKGASPAEIITRLRDALINAGVSSQELSSAARDAGVKLDELSVALRNSEDGTTKAKTNLDSVGSSALDAGNKIGSLAQNAQNSSSVLNAIDYTPVKNNISGIQTAIDSVNFNKLSTNSSDAITSINNVWSEGKGSILDAVTGALDKNIQLEDLLKSKYSGYAAFSVKGYSDKINELKSKTQGEMKNFAQNAIMNPFASKLGIHSPSTVFAGYGQNLISGLKNGIDDKSGTALDSMENIGNRLKRLLDDTLNNMESSTDRSMTNLGNSFDEAQINASNAASNIATAFSNIHIPLPHIDVGWDNWSIGDLSFSVPRFNINWYKKGGLFNGASVIGVGEDGQEAVLPLENKRTMSMIADSIISNASGMGMDEETLTNAVARGVAMAMMNNMQGQSTPEYIQNSIYMDSEVMARAVTKAQEKIDYRMNPTPKFA